jgi:hypothetical protein
MHTSIINLLKQFTVINLMYNINNINGVVQYNTFFYAGSFETYFIKLK